MRCCCATATHRLSSARKIKKTYLDTLEHGSLRDDLKPFQTFMHRRLDATLGEYLGASQEAQPPTLKHDKPGIPIPSH